MANIVLSPKETPDEWETGDPCVRCGRTRLRIRAVPQHPKHCCVGCACNYGWHTDACTVENP